MLARFRLTTSTRGTPMITPETNLPPSVNFHLWQPCNMRCHFCFAVFDDVVKDRLPKGHLAEAECITMTRILAQHFSKVTFVGGEPTLCPWLDKLIEVAHEEGATTMLVTNGSRLNRGWLESVKGRLDWVTLSIDSASPATHLRLGRAVRGQHPLEPGHYLEVAGMLRESRIRFKVNTVVTALNADEDMAPFIRQLRPERWKIFQVLPVDGQNDGKVEPLLLSDVRFQAFVERHRMVEGDGIVLVPEDNEDMTGSYAMVDPAGRFFDNTQGRYRYSRPILEVGPNEAWSDVRFELGRFLSRGGDYEWATPRAARAP